MAAGERSDVRLGEGVGTIPINLPKTSESKEEQGVTGTKSKGQMATKCKQARMHLFTLDQLPDVPLDKILSYLTSEDLRRLHQVSKSWKNIVQSRPRVDSRRVDLVKQIRQNKENIPDKQDSLTPISKRPQGANLTCSDGKPGGRQLLGQITNPRLSAAHDTSRAVLQTPTSRFLQEFEAGKKLIKGQQLFRCPECHSPVPSPVSAISKGVRTTRPAAEISGSDTSLNANQDSGYQSTNSISTDIQDEEEDQDASSSNEYPDYNENYSNEEISMSVIRTPEVPESTGKDLDQNLFIVTSKLLENSSKSIGKMRFKSVFNDSSSSTPEVPPRTSLSNPGIAECPNCLHKFCCNCQSTAHPGRNCFVIDSEILSTPLPNFSLLDSTLHKSKQKSGKKALRRLARL